MTVSNLPPADWSVWSHIPEVELWTAVALSLNIEPSALKFMGQFHPDDPYKKHPHEFNKRLFIAVNNTKTLGAIFQDRYTYPAIARVLLADFADWAVNDIGLSGLPPELVALTYDDDSADESPTESVNKGTPKRWTDEALAELANYHTTEGTRLTAAKFGVTAERVRQLLRRIPPAPTSNNPFGIKQKQ